MKKLSVLICDDDPAMRDILSVLCSAQDGYQVIGQAGDGEQAMALFEQYRPEVVFLDVQIPKCSGVECARRMADMIPDTCIIFATAHPDYRAQAFEVYAFDYLVKPFDLDRVKETLTRIRAARVAREPVMIESVNGASQNKVNKLMIRQKEGVRLIDPAEIVLIQREDRNTVIYTPEDRIVTHESLAELMEKLDRSLFFRSHKSYIINISRITHIYPYGRWTYVVKLKGITPDALITAERFDELVGRLNGLA